MWVRFPPAAHKKNRKKRNGAWRSWLARCVWDAEVVGSSPTAPTMNIKNKILEDIKTALKQKDEFKLSCLRFLNAQIYDKEIEQARKKLKDEDVFKLIAGEIKKLEESLKLFEKAKRQDLQDKAKKEIEVLKAYLPKQIADEELEKEIDKIISENKDVNNPGQLIGIAVKALSGKADNKKIAQLVLKKFKKN